MAGVVTGNIDDVPSRAIRATWGTLSPMITPEAVGSSKLEVTFIEINPGTEPGPRHYHAQAENAFIVLEGEIRLSVEGRDFELGPFDFAWVPAGLVHAVQNVGGDQVARLIEIYGPAGRDFNLVDHPGVG